MNWVVYIIEAENGTLYTGITNNLRKRFENHLSGKQGARYFQLSKPKEIVYTENCKDRSEASKREHQIKKLTREEKIELIRKTQRNL